MTDYTEMAIQLLKDAPRLRVARLNLDEEILILEEAKTSPGGFCSGTPVSSGGSNRYEQKLVNLIQLCDDLRLRRKQMQTDLNRIERGMSVLCEYEKDLLEAFYCEGKINRARGAAYESAAERMMCKHAKERSTIYRDKQSALEKFTQALYG